jgi:hypothetical protein
MEWVCANGYFIGRDNGMKPYGMEKKDRIKCTIKGCSCGDFSSKHPKEKGKNWYNQNKRLKKRARQDISIDSD